MTREFEMDQGDRQRTQAAPSIKCFEAHRKSTSLTITLDE